MKNAEFEIKHINQTVEDFQKDIRYFKIENDGRTYGIRHINQTIEDFQKDIHRFEIEYDGRTYSAYCVGGVTVEFEYGIITEIRLHMMKKIFYMIDIYEHTDAWPVPDGAQKIADDYCKEEFCQEVSE